MTNPRILSVKKLAPAAHPKIDENADLTKKN